MRRNMQKSVARFSIFFYELDEFFFSAKIIVLWFFPDSLRMSRIIRPSKRSFSSSSRDSDSRINTCGSVSEIGRKSVMI